jgi:flagellar assembly protein FliH
MSEHAPQLVQSWVLPSVDGPVVGQRRPADLNQIERAAWEQGFAGGRAAGLAAAQAEQARAGGEARAQVARLDEILALLAAPLAELDDAVLLQVATLAGQVARQVVRRELRADPQQIIAVIRETLALLPVAAREVRVHLHPEDAALVRERLAEPNAERAWSVIEDPVIGRGGCRISSENSTIDAQVEARLGAAVAAALGDERGTTRGSGA